MKFESYHFVLKYKHHRIHDDTTLKEQSKKRLTNIASISECLDQRIKNFSLLSRVDV